MKNFEEENLDFWKMHDSEYIHYFYKITNNLDNKFYYGIHSEPKNSGKHPLNDGYWGSGTAIRAAIKKQGRENFTKECIKIFSTREELRNYEKEIVTEELVKNPNCYNRVVGGEGLSPTAGMIPCVLVSNPEKTIMITKEEYLKNKEIYRHIANRKHRTKKSEKKKRLYVRTRKLNDEDTFAGSSRYFVNKNTLELKKYIGHDLPEELYDKWFPSYFLDKRNNKFISSEYLKYTYSNLGSLEKVAKEFGISVKNLSTIRNYYIDQKEILEGFFKETHHFGGGFKDRAWINNGKINRAINKREIDNYLKEGWIKGKVHINKLNFLEVFNFYCKGNSLEECEHHFHTTSKYIKEALKIDSTWHISWFHKEEKQIRLLVNKEVTERLIKNDWVPGIKSL